MMVHALHAWHVLRWLILCGATLPLIYYSLAIYCVRGFFHRGQTNSYQARGYTPPVSILKPVKGLDRDAYENFASFCRLDYPAYEVLFAVADGNDPAVPVIERVMKDYPGRSIRLFVGSETIGLNKKVNKLCRLEREAKSDLLVVNDSDIRVGPDYLRTVVAPFQDPKVGAVTCLYVGVPDKQLGAELEAIGIATEFHAGVLVARHLEGVKFALGSTMATTRQRLEEFGGFRALADCHSDDFELGRRIAALGYVVEIPRYVVWTVCPELSAQGYFAHQLRWGLTTRFSRPWGHIGSLLTMGLPWSLAAATVAPSIWIGTAYLAAYLILRLALAWTLGAKGLGDSLVRRKLWLVPLRDALAFPIWLCTFFFNRIDWRGTSFQLHGRQLVPIVKAPVPAGSIQEAPAGGRR